MNNYNFYKYYTLYFVLYGIGISLLIAVVTYTLSLQQIQENLDAKAEEIYNIKIATILKPTIENMDDLVRALGENRVIEKFLQTNDAHAESELEEIFLALATSQKQIMQVRLLDASGQEIIRIDRTTQEALPQIVPHQQLQNKKERDYFQAISHLAKSQIWHSKLNLNIEHGKVEIPYKPTIRIGLPLYIGEKFAGIVIVNLYVQTLIEAISSSSVFDHYILDKDNNFIVHPIETYAFNQYKGTKRSLEEDFPDGLQANDVYTFDINPFLANDDKATLVFKVKEKYEEQILQEKIATILIVLVLSVLFSIIVAYFISKKPIILQQSLLKAHQKLEQFTAIIDKYIITSRTKKSSTIVSVSSAFEEISGYKKEEIIGKKMRVVRHPEQDKSLFEDLWETILMGKTWVGTIKNRRKTGEAYYLEQHIIPNFSESGEIDSFVSIGIDVTAKIEIQKLSRIDVLTGIYNRGALDEILEQEIKVAHRYKNPLSLLMFDIDFFKSVNDTFGHQRGDAVLQDIVKIIASVIRESDVFGRFGGEEFMLIAVNTNEQEAFVLAEKIREAVEAHNFEEVGRKTISIGVCEFIADDTLENLIKKADSALYKAKQNGRNQVSVFR